MDKLGLYSDIESGKKVCSFMAGHSVGEYSALCSARCFSIGDVAYITRMRAQCIIDSVKNREYAIAALFPVKNISEIEKLCASATLNFKEECNIACYNSPTQVVISGDSKAVSWVVEMAKKEHGIKKSTPLKVSAPFHSKYLLKAESSFSNILKNIKSKVPNVPLVSNVTGKPVNDTKMIKDLLVQSISRPVQWTMSIENLKDNGISTFIELGPKKILSSLIKNIYPKSTVYSISTLEEMDQFLSKNPIRIS